MGWYVLAADAPVMRCLQFGADNSCEWSRLSGYECQIVCRVVRHHSSTLQSGQQPAMTFCLKSARNCHCYGVSDAQQGQPCDGGRPGGRIASISQSNMVSMLASLMGGTAVSPAPLQPCTGMVG